MSEYIRKVYTENTGGGVLVDYVYLKNGVVLGVTDDSVVVFQSENEKEQNEPFEWSYFD